MRPTDVPEEGLICDLLWSDPEDNTTGWGENDRGVSWTFNEKVLKNFLEENDLDLLCRAHQVVEEGYEFFGNRQLVTVLAPQIIAANLIIMGLLWMSMKN